MVDCILEAGRAAWTEKCLIVCAATEADMVTDIVMVGERQVVYNSVLLSLG